MWLKPRFIVIVAVLGLFGASSSWAMGTFSTVKHWLEGYFEEEITEEHPNTLLISGVYLPKVITIDPEHYLILNGAAAKRKAQHTIFVSALYLERQRQRAKQVFKLTGHKRFLLHCKTDFITPHQIIETFREGFELNHTDVELVRLDNDIHQFNQLWTDDIIKDQQIWINYTPGIGTQVFIDNTLKGIIAGDAFYTAFLKVWIGEIPYSRKHKMALLGIEN